MNKYKNSIFYIATIGGFSALIYWIINKGKGLEAARSISLPNGSASQWDDFVDGFLHNLQHPLAILLAQIVTIIIVARLFGWICIKLKQPAVIGEMFAGIVLGPSLIGLYFPEFSATLFPKQSMGNLQFLSQIGLILFMFIVGMEIDMKILKNKAHDAVVISHASIMMPFALGIGLAYFLYEEFAPAHTDFLSFALFTGIAMSITAFPVLARIIQERGIHKTRLGTIVITCAAADDITAWCILAAVIAIVKAGSFGSALYTLLLAIGYVLIMLKIVQPFLKRIGELYAPKENISKPIVALFFLTLILSSYATEVIGIHALFGAFVAGAIMPDNIKFRNLFIEKIEDVALVLLLPLFFVFTGLRTQIGLLNDIYLWKIAGLIFIVAVIGKFVSSALAAKFVGQSWKDSLSIGALMNTRGLTELVVLNIGYDLGVLSPELFSMMVVMALATTFMTGPTLDLINWIYKKKEIKINPADDEQFNILLSFGLPDSGRRLLKLANSFTRKTQPDTLHTVMHFSPASVHHYDMDAYEKETFGEIQEEAACLNQKINTLFKASSDVDNEISQVANKGNYDLLLVGMGHSIFEGTLLGKVLGLTSKIMNPEKLLNTVTGKENIFTSSHFDEGTQKIISRSNTPVGVLIDKNFDQLTTICLAVLDTTDLFLLDYAKRLIENTGARITIWDQDGVLTNSDVLQNIRLNNPGLVQVEAAVPIDLIQQKDLLLMSAEGWKLLITDKNEWLPHIPSTLIISTVV